MDRPGTSDELPAEPWSGLHDTPYLKPPWADPTAVLSGIDAAIGIKPLLARCRAYRESWETGTLGGGNRILKAVKCSGVSSRG